MAPPQTPSQTPSPSTTTTTLPTTLPTTNPPTTTPTPPPLRPIFLTLLLACPILLLLPPRKLDLYTFSLAGAWAVSAEEVAFGSGRRRRRRADGGGGAGAGDVKGGMFGPGGEEKAKRESEDETRGLAGSLGDDGKDRDEEDARAEGQVGGEAAAAEEAGVKGLAKKIWMGDERPGWQKRRLEREREELGRGKGYGDIILGQVREVFPGFGGGGGGGRKGEGEGGGGRVGGEKEKGR